MAHWLVTQCKHSVRRVCKLLGLSQSVYRYTPKPKDDIEVIDLDRRTMEYLYSDNTGATFMDTESYEQFVMPEDVLGEALKFLRPNAQTIVLLHDGNPVTLELPPAVE